MNEISRRPLDVDRARDPRGRANLPAPRLWRSRSNRVVLGVIGGLAEKFGWETRPVRILWGFLGVLTLPLAGLPVVIPYVTLWAITEGRGPVGPARSLRRSRTNQVFAGVLAGVADWLGIKANVTRVLYSFLTLATFIVPGVVTYLVLWAKMPVEDPRAEEDPRRLEEGPRRLSV